MNWMLILQPLLGILLVGSLWFGWEVFKARWHYRYLRERRTRRFWPMRITSPYDSKTVAMVDVALETAWRTQTSGCQPSDE